MKEQKIIIFYDGACGLCHAFIRFVLYKLDLSQSFIFCPQESHRFEKLKNKFSQKTFPDSIAVYSESCDQLVFKTKAVILVLKCLRWPWKILVFLLQCVPTFIADFFYDLLAKKRHALFKKPTGACPIIPSNLKRFFIND